MTFEFLNRYAGESLGSSPHIVVLGSYKVGNFVVSTPVLHGLKARFPDCIIGFIGSDITSALEEAHPCVDWRVSWDSSDLSAASNLHAAITNYKASFGTVSLAINLDGFNPVTCALSAWIRPFYVAGGCLSANLRRALPWGELPQQSFLADSDWDSIAFLERYSNIFSSNYIAELFCELAFVRDYVDPYAISLPTKLPDFLVPHILIHCTTARSAKLWPYQFWQEVIQFVSNLGFTIGLIGSAPKLQHDLYNSGLGEDFLIQSTPLIDLRGKTNLLELAGACSAAMGLVTVDAGPMHIAAAVGTPTLVLLGNDSDQVGPSPMRLWMPRCSNVSYTVSTFSCDRCAVNSFRNDECLLEEHSCMNNVLPSQVITWLSTVLKL